MRKLIAFNHISLDGYFTGANGDFSWARTGNDDPEYQAFVKENASGGGALVFGRVTYQMMASYWPTPMARQHAAEVAEQMNGLEKIVFSRTLQEASWNNTTLLGGDLLTEVRKLKAGDGAGMAILGSGTIVAQLASASLIDEYQVVVNPVVLGAGRTMFDSKADLKLIRTRTFANGKIYLCYEPKG
jgi:dihydrofolate reductase